MLENIEAILEDTRIRSAEISESAPENNEMEIKELLVLIRAKLNLSQEALARDLNVSFTTINRWELGKTKPSRRYVALIEEYCKEKGVSCNEKI